MKINLDRAGATRLYGFGIGFYAAIFFIGLTVMIWQMPASWVASALSSGANCHLTLNQPSGSLWEGSAAIGFSEPDQLTGKCRPPNAITERFQWRVSCQPFQGSCQGQIQFSALLKPLIFQLALDGLRVDPGEAILPANILEVMGSPWTTLRPRGEMKVNWTAIQMGVKDENSKGIVHILVNNLESPISPIKPLGTYDLAINLLRDGGSWDISTVRGPLLLEGIGAFGKEGFHFSGEVSSTPESQESLIGLLSLMGKKTGNTYRVQF